MTSTRQVPSGAGPPRSVTTAPVVTNEASSPKVRLTPTSDPGKWERVPWRSWPSNGIPTLRDPQVTISPPPKPCDNLEPEDSWSGRVSPTERSKPVDALQTKLDRCQIHNRGEFEVGTLPNFSNR